MLRNEQIEQAGLSDWRKLAQGLQRFHLDVWVPPEVADARIAADLVTQAVCSRR